MKVRLEMLSCSKKARGFVPLLAPNGNRGDSDGTVDDFSSLAIRRRSILGRCCPRRKTAVGAFGGSQRSRAAEFYEFI